MAADRQTRSAQMRARIKLAFTELIREKGFDALTVSDVARRAGINRGTIYLHFTDKYDLLDSLEAEAVSGLTRILTRDSATPDTDDGTVEMFPFEVIRAALEYVAADFDFISAISSMGGDAQFSTKFHALVESFLDEGLARTGMHVEGTDLFPEPYARELALSHVMTIVNLWIARGGKEDPSQVAAMVCAAKDLSPVDFAKAPDAQAADGAAGID